MAAGLMRRYRDAGVAPPELLYVDRHPGEDRCAEPVQGVGTPDRSSGRLALYAAVLCGRRHREPSSLPGIHEASLARCLSGARKMSCV